MHILILHFFLSGYFLIDPSVCVRFLLFIPTFYMSTYIFHYPVLVCSILFSIQTYFLSAEPENNTAK